MTDLHQLTYWAVAFVLFVVLPVLATRPPVLRRLIGRRMSRLGAWAWVRLAPPPAVDLLAEELYRARRLQSLYADVARLQRILATDTAMSATRQLGNRLAHAWLVAELERTRRLSRNIFEDQVFAGWDPTVGSHGPAAPVMVYAPRHGSTVEVLDIGWRH